MLAFCYVWCTFEESEAPFVAARNFKLLFFIIFCDWAFTMTEVKPLLDPGSLPL